MEPGGLWIRLGEGELLNLAHVISLKKGPGNTIEIRYINPGANRTVRFQAPEERDEVFERIVENMRRLGLALE